MAVVNAHVEPVHTSTGLSHAKLGMWAFLASECLLFGALISTFLLYKGRHVTGLTPQKVYDIPYTSVSSFVLLMSSLTMVLALAAIQRGDQAKLRVWLIATALLGMTFISGQVYEFTRFVQDGMTIKTNVIATSFFTLTGFHGAHVTAGVLWLSTMLAIDYRRNLTSKDSLLVDICALYWHFVDVVWIAIFTLVYLIK